MGGRSMNAALDRSEPGQWCMGGVNDASAQEVMGFSECEAAQAAVFAYQAVTDPNLRKLGRERLLRGLVDAFREGLRDLADV